MGNKETCKGCIYDNHTKGNNILVPCCHPKANEDSFWKDPDNYSCKVTKNYPLNAHVREE